MSVGRPGPGMIWAVLLLFGEQLHFQLLQQVLVSLVFLYLQNEVPECVV